MKMCPLYVTVLTFFAAIVTPVSAQNEINGLSCSIKMESEELRIGDPVEIQVKIENSTDQAINFFYQDLYIAEKLEIKNDQGQIMDSVQTVTYNWPHPKNFYRRIEPGQQFTHQIKGRVRFRFYKAQDLPKKMTDRELRIDFHDVDCLIRKTGKFSATLQLSADQNTQAQGESFGLENIWTSHLQSNPIAFTVRPMLRKELNQMIELLRDGNDEEKTEAIEVLSANADKKAVKQLMQIVKSGRGLHLRKAADTLVRIQDTSILPELMNLYKEPAPYSNTAGEFKQIVLMTIKGLEEDRQKINELFVKIIKSQASVDETSYAVWELAMANYQSALPAMIELAEKHQVRKQYAAIDALGSFGTRLEGQNRQKVLKALLEIMKNDPDRRVRQRAVAASASVGGDSISANLVEALKDSDPRVRNAAAIYLGRYGSSEAITPLKAYLDTLDNQQYIKVAAESIEYIHQRNDGIAPNPE